MDNRLLWNKAQGDKKDHVLKEMTWNNIRKSVELSGLFQIIQVFSKIPSVELVQM